MARARVLHVLKRFRPEFTGEGVFTERLTPVMNMIAPDVEHEMLATLTLPGANGYRGTSALRKVHYINEPGTTSEWRREFNLLRWFLLNMHRYNVVHFHTHADRYFLTYILAKLFGRRLVISATLDDSVTGLVNTYRPSLRSMAS